MMDFVATPLTTPTPDTFLYPGRSRQDWLVTPANAGAHRRSIAAMGPPR